jgi:hypothetical protein
MEYTFPRNYEAMKGKVASDIYKIYATTGSVYEDIHQKNPSAADAFSYFVSLNRWKIARDIMRTESPKFGSLPLSPFDGGVLHERMRDGKGSIKKGMRPLFVVREPGKKSKLGKYIESKQKTIGMAKAGWYQCWQELKNAEGAPKWVTRHRKLDLSEVTHGGSEQSPTLTLHNKARYAGGAMDARYQDHIETVARDRMIDFLKRQLGHK